MTSLKPCHPVPGLYTDIATGKTAYIVDDFGNAVHLITAGIMGQWAGTIANYSIPEH